MKQLSAMVLVLLLAVAPSCKYFNKPGLFGKKERTLASLLAQQDSIRIADSLNKVDEKLAAIEKERLDSVRKEEEARQAAEIKGKYNIIVGSFHTPEYAKSLAESYRQRGYETKILKMERSNFELVSAESHESLRKAISRLRQFRDTVEMEAWIYTRK
jgi:hypothetical protein